MLVEMGFTGDTRVYYCTVCLHLVEETIYLIKLYIHSERVLFFFTESVFSSSLVTVFMLMFMGLGLIMLPCLMYHPALLKLIVHNIF